MFAPIRAIKISPIVAMIRARSSGMRQQLRKEANIKWRGVKPYLASGAGAEAIRTALPPAFSIFAFAEPENA